VSREHEARRRGSLIPEFTSIEHHGAINDREVGEIREQILLPDLPDLLVESSTQASFALDLLEVEHP
jgi:hypothetical protein